MNPTNPAIDPELTLLGRFLAWIGSPLTSEPVRVHIAPNSWGGVSLYPANDAARELLGGDEPTGNFASEADARKRIDWNCWEESVEPRTATPPHSPATTRAPMRVPVRRAA